MSELDGDAAGTSESPTDREVPRPAVDQAYPTVDGMHRLARRQLPVLREHARAPSPAPGRDAGPIDEFVWGLAQPILGVRVLMRHGDLFVRGLIPAALFILVCAVVVDGSEATGIGELATAYYGVLVGAASVSPVLFCRNYAKLAAEARRHLDLPRHEPYLRSYKQALVEGIVQAIVLGVGIAPWAALIGLLPLFGGMWAVAIGWLWILHWIVVEAFDSARTLGPDESPELLEQQHATLDPPWYSGAALRQLRAPLPTLLLPFRLWGIVMARIGRRWRGEVALVEARPWLAAGFGLGASVLLLIPVFNLMFRPAIVVAASHVLGRLALEQPDPPAGAQLVLVAAAPDPTPKPIPGPAPVQ